MSKKIPGIYYIKNNITNQIYIGQSVNVTNRLKTHFTQLQYRKHPNLPLQKSFIEYGENNFTCGLIKSCKQPYLDRFEKLYIQKYNSLNPKYGFNLYNGKTKTDDYVIKPIRKYVLELVNGKYVRRFVSDDIGYVKLILRS